MARLVQNVGNLGRTKENSWSQSDFFNYIFLVVFSLQLVWSFPQVGGNIISRSSPNPHPLDPLSETEIKKTSDIIRMVFGSVPLIFSTISLQEPNKAELLTYFLADLQPPKRAISRRSFAIVIDPVRERTSEIVVDLERQVIVSSRAVKHGLQPMYTIDEDDDIDATVLNDKNVRSRFARLGITNLSNVIPEFWDFGYAGDRPQYLGRRIVTVYFQTVNFHGDNNYAHPVGFVAIVDVLQKRVLDIEELPIHEGFDTKNRQGEFVPTATHNYDPTLRPNDVFRKDVSPISCSQPSGPSFKGSGNLIEWQKFKFRIGFNGREGLVLHHINYNDKGHVRPLIYRAALSELFVPYGDPRPPFHRLMAFDVGQYGIGISAHELQTPADCSGSVQFFDIVVSNKGGMPVRIKQAVCIFEEDVGSLVKKYDSLTGRSFVIRSQRLVVTFTATLSNYDYQFKWMFYQDASIKVEVQLHGIDNPSFVATGVSSGVHGNIISPNIIAQNHQHLIVVRLDTEIDGNANTVATVDVVPDGSTGSSRNPYGNAFKAVETVLTTSGLARTNGNPATARTWKIYGEMNSINPISKTPMGYRLIAENPTHLMINLDSPLHPKCAFVDYDVWVTAYHEDQLYAGGLYLNNSGLPEWVEQNENVENTDIVLWHVFGLTHIPRTEDFPVMPTETVGFWLKPTNFFLENPALDVPPFLHVPPSS